MKRVKAFVSDQPFMVDLLLLGSTVVHFVITMLGLVPNIWAGLLGSDQGPTQALYLGVLQPAAVVAGFAGVVVIFGLTADAERFRTFRANAGNSLKRTWVSSTLSGFEACLLCIVAASLSVAGLASIGPWLFELALLALIHGSLRLVWILSGLIGIVWAEDVKKTQDAAVYRVEELPFNSKKKKKAS